MIKTVGYTAHRAYAELRPALCRPWSQLRERTQIDYEIMASAVVEQCACLLEQMAKDEHIEGQTALVHGANALRELKYKDPHA